ncbi:MAG TPA: aspartate aminotransferase family protein [Deltaproteobacteria bacterium]|nr:aspartate aminotransferase family protein [Candidatus Binatota bacterium]HIL12921.1 aspartate aminotransferase family protein [Deltaproteobacteria bacterium]
MAAKLSPNGMSKQEVMDRMRGLKQDDADWRGARTWSLVFPAGEDVDEVLEAAHREFLFENALNPFRFPSLRVMEEEVVEMTADLLNAPEGARGCMTSGGTESILAAVKAARDHARAERNIAEPELLVPASAHPAFIKAAHYLDMPCRRIELADDLRADLDSARQLVGPATAMLVASAPNYPHGLIDPVEELAALAAEHNAFCHVDACVGGFILPFLERTGVPLPAFDFRVPGVTSMSADVHKYGYATKGASVVIHRDAHTLLNHQAFFFDDWPGGMYGSLAVAGTRPASAIAAAWAVMNYLGEEGYLERARVVAQTSAALKAGISAIDGLRLVGDPPASLMAFCSDQYDMGAIGDVMDARGWHLDRQERPPALHMMVTPNHAQIVERFLDDLRFAVSSHGESKGKSARYN